MPTSSFDKEIILTEEEAEKLLELLKEDVMINIIKQIRKIIGNHWSSQIFINIYPDEICFEIYETKVPIVFDLKGKYVYLECETSNHHLTADMLDELSQIVSLLQENFDEITKILD